MSLTVFRGYNNTGDGLTLVMKDLGGYDAVVHRSNLSDLFGSLFLMTAPLLLYAEYIAPSLKEKL